MDLLWFIRKKEEKKKTEENIREIRDLFDYTKNSTADLIGLYRSEKYMLERMENRNQGMPVESNYYKETKKMEDEIISRISDEFEKKVLRIIVSFNLNLLEYMGDKWKEEIKEACFHVCHYLKFGNRYPEKSSVYDPLPFPGKEIFTWFLSHAGNNKDNRFKVAMDYAVEEFKKNRFMGIEFPKDKIKNENLPPLLEGMGYRLILLMSPEFAREVKIMFEMWKMEDGKGKEYIENILKDMP